jgi:PKD repeat protein
MPSVAPVMTADRPLPLPIAGPTVPNAMRRDEEYWSQRPQPITLLSRKVDLSTELPPDTNAADRHIYLVQFGGPLDDTLQTALAAAGVDVLLPTVACAYHTRASHDALTALSATFQPRVLGWARLLPADKLLPAVKARATSHAHVEVDYRLELYPGANAAAVRYTIQLRGGKVLETARDVFEVRGSSALSFALNLAAIDDVYAVDTARPVKRVSNQQAAAASRIDLARGAPRNLTGAGITIMVRDEGAVFVHPDLISRISLNSDAGTQPIATHATHICGTIGGTGSINAAAQGMATACNLVVYDLFGDDVNEPLQAKASYGAILSNHSYNFITGWNAGTFTDNQNTFGAYGSFSRNWDSIVQSENLLIVKSAGNDRNDSGPGFPHDGTLGVDGEYYDTTDASTTGKNILSVGAAVDAAAAGSPSSALQVLPSSSSGPCDDGRLRPEIIANGDNVLSCNTNAAPGSEYTTLLGTSSSCAVVTGASAVFLQRYKQRFGSTTSAPPHYLRALFAQTATDMGRAGPDYLHGFGMLDLEAALALFDLDTSAGLRIKTNTLTSAVPERFYALTSDGVTPIKATLCWNDAPGDILAAKSIINDLDLRLIRISDQSVARPFVLSAANPHLPATAGINTVDTIEQLILQAPAAGSYLLAVRGTTLSNTTPFTLVSSHDLVENLAPVAKIVPSKTSGPPPLQVTFDASTSTDADGMIVSYVWDFGDTGTANGVLVSHAYNTGSYVARLTVFDNQGASATTTVAIGVANLPPRVLVAATPDNGLPPLTLLLTSAGSVDPDGTIVDYSWDFGDGTKGNGAAVTHTYTSLGLYAVKLTATDDGGAVVNTNGSVFIGQSLAARACSFKVNFAKAGTDRFTFSTKTLAISPVLNTSGLAGSITIGNTLYTFVLDEKGRYKQPPLNIQLQPAKGILKVTLTRTVLAGALANAGVSDRDAVKEPVRVPFAIQLQNGLVFGSPGLQLLYSAKRGRTGSGKLVPP